MQTTTTPAAPPVPRKKRRWKIFAGFALVFIAAPLTYWFISGWLADRELAAIVAEIEADDPNWRWDDLIAQLEPPPDDANAAVQINKVYDFLKVKPFNPGPKFNSGANDKVLAVRNARLRGEYAEALKSAFGRLDPKCLAEARKLKDLPDGRFAIEAVDNPFLLQMAYIQDTREVMNLLSYDAMLRGQDDPDGAAESCLALIHAAHAINDHPTLIGQLVRMAGQGMSVAAVERLLGQGVVAEKNLAPLQAALQREADTNSVHLGLRGERAFGEQIFASVRDGKMPISQILGGGRASPGIGERVLDAFPGLILRGHAEHLRFTHDQVKASKLDNLERVEAFRKLEQKARESRNWSIRLLIPAVTKVNEAGQRTQAHLRCAVAGVAAERYRLRHGVWPTGLKDLVREGLLKDLPKDPYDGQPLRWRATPTGVIIYSVGLDKTDNGGKLQRDNLRAKDIDYGFELFDPQTSRGIAPPAIMETR